MLFFVFISSIRCFHWLLKHIKQFSDTCIMEFLPNGSKHVIQSGDSGYADSKGKGESNANLAVKPTVNLNLNPVSSFNLQQTMDSSVLDEQNQNYLEAKPEGRSVAKVAVTNETGKSGLLGTPVVSPIERDNVFQQKSKIPSLACSLMSEDQLNRRGVQRLKSPNLKHTPTMSPKALPNSKMAENPSHFTVKDKEKSEVHRDSASVSIPNPHAIKTTEETTRTGNKILKLNTSQKGEGEMSQNTNSSTPSVRQKVKEDSKLAHQTLKTSIENERDGKVLLSTKNSKSPKTSTERKTASTTNKSASRSKENINSKESSTASGSKPQSKDNLDSKSGSVSKTSMGSKDSLDLKPGASSNSKSGKGSRDGLSKTAVDSSKLRPVLQTSKSAGADLSLPLPVSPRPISAKRSPGSAPKSLGPSGPSREAQRSPGAARG